VPGYGNTGLTLWLTFKLDRPLNIISLQEKLQVIYMEHMDYKHTAFMGFWEVIKNLRTIRKHFAFCKKDIKAFEPDRIIYIDYPGFNMRMADWSNKNGYHNIYFVAPQIWAWKKNRYKKIKRDIKQLFVILPFEKGFYKGLGIEAKYFGHPLVANIQQMPPKSYDPKSLNIAILTGSRHQELQKHLPVFAEKFS